MKWIDGMRILQNRMSRFIAVALLLFCVAASTLQATDFEDMFRTPPDSARPGVYWYFMDGNMSREGMTADLEAMKHAGIGQALFLEVNIGVPRGPVDFMSMTWQDNFTYMIREAHRLGIEMIIGAGPGWCGNGGPWVKPEESMQHLCTSRVQVKGPGPITDKLPVPEPWKLSQWSGLSGRLADIRNAWYEDIAVLAFPTPKGDRRIEDIEGKALYARGPYSSMQGIKPFFPASANYPVLPAEETIHPDRIIDLTDKMKPDGSLDWSAPEGDWTIMRFAARSTGQTTRPAPAPGYGFETDKFSRQAQQNHFNAFTGKLLEKIGPGPEKAAWKRFHLDSWESGAQNWTKDFAVQFQRRRGYDPMPFFPAYSGVIVGSLEQTERFLWDLRLTAQELVLENHAQFNKSLAHQNGWILSIEPYDMNFAGDLDLGAVADIPMCEFWSPREGCETVYSCIEAASIAHTMGYSRVDAESFTTDGGISHNPAQMKNLTDWAFCIGINGIIFHTFQHQPLGPEYLPGMSMGPYGVHWHRNQTFWPMVSEYHRYISRCSYLLRQGKAVADILYLTAEGVPNIVLPPAGAMQGTGFMRDMKGFRFDCVSPRILMERAQAAAGKITFPNGTSYQLLILPRFDTMTPELLTKIKDLVSGGAVLVGTPPLKSPSLVDYPACDNRVRELANELWGGFDAPKEMTRRSFGKGTVCWGGEISALTADNTKTSALYPSYEITAKLLRQSGISEDFSTEDPVRFVHRQTDELEIYFVSNRSDKRIDASGTFRVHKTRPGIWHPVTGLQWELPEFTVHPAAVSVPLRFEPYESYFVVFPRNQQNDKSDWSAKKNFPSMTQAMTIEGPWNVSFDPARGGPETIVFESLQDWTSHNNEGIKYYSGIAAYRKIMDLPENVKPTDSLFLDLGIVHNIARIRVNGKDIGIVWTAPWQVRLTGLKQQGNMLEIEVANTWVNRLIGDEQPENRNVRNVKWDNGLLEGKTYPAGRYTFINNRRYKADSPLMPSGLLGPVRILREE